MSHPISIQSNATALSSCGRCLVHSTQWACTLWGPGQAHCCWIRRGMMACQAKIGMQCIPILACEHSSKPFHNTPVLVSFAALPSEHGCQQAATGTLVGSAYTTPVHPGKHQCSDCTGKQWSFLGLRSLDSSTGLGAGRGGTPRWHAGETDCQQIPTPNSSHATTSRVAASPRGCADATPDTR